MIISWPKLDIEEVKVLRNRQEEIKKKGFVMDAKPEIKDPENYDFSRIKVGLQ